MPGFYRQTGAGLWLSMLLMLVPMTAAASELSVTAQAPQTIKRVDYRAPDSASKSRVRVVEKYHWQKALDCMAAGNMTCANSNLHFILNWVPNHPYALMKMSALQKRLGQTQKADTYMDDAIRFSPTDPAVFVVYGIHLQRTDRNDAAIKKYEQAIELDPKQSDAHYNLGLAYLEANKPEKANEHAQVAYRLGHGLPGLRDKLKQRGAWKPAPDQNQAAEPN